MPLVFILGKFKFKRGKWCKQERFCIINLKFQFFIILKVIIESLMIHEADPKSRPVVITILSVPHLQNGANPYKS